MRIEIRADSVLLDGYVNAVGRESRIIRENGRNFREIIEPKTFERALHKTQDLPVLLNHNSRRVLGSTKQGNLQLSEDNIGLRAMVTITDKEVIEKAREGKLVGWSFGFRNAKDQWEETNEEGVQRRRINDLDLDEVTILDDTKVPAYYGTSISTRDGVDTLTETRSEEFKAVVIDNAIAQRESEFDNSLYLKKVELIKIKGGF